MSWKWKTDSTPWHHGNTTQAYGLLFFLGSTDVGEMKISRQCLLILSENKETGAKVVISKGREKKARSHGAPSSHAFESIFFFPIFYSARFRIFGSSEILILGIFIIMKIPTKLWRCRAADHCAWWGCLRAENYAPSSSDQCAAFVCINRIQPSTVIACPAWNGKSP